MKVLEENESSDEGHFEVVQALGRLLLPGKIHSHAEAIPLVRVMVPEALCIFVACAVTEIFGVMHSAMPCGPMAMART